MMLNEHVIFESWILNISIYQIPSFTIYHSQNITLTFTSTKLLDKLWPFYTLLTVQHTLYIQAVKSRYGSHC